MPQRTVRMEVDKEVFLLLVENAGCICAPPRLSACLWQ